MADNLNLRNPNGYDGQPGTVHKQGIVRLATDAQAIAGTDEHKVLTPANLAAALAGGLSPVFATVTATLVTSTTINTRVAAAQLVLNGTTLSATGTDANVSLNFATKGTGSLVFSRSAAGVDLNMQITNSDNTAAAGSAGLQLAVGGATSTGDPYVRFEISGVAASTMSMGLDNSNSDLFVISNSNTLGTSNALTLTQAGALACTTTFTAGTGITATTGNIVASTGNISSTLGSLAAATTVTAGTGITSTTGNIVATAGAVNAGTSMTATLGAITATNGNLVLNTAGNGVRVKSGANARIGIGAVLVGGALVIANTSVTANTVIIPVITALGTVAAPKALYVTKNAGVGFTVTSADATDTSTFDWYMVEAV